MNSRSIRRLGSIVAAASLLTIALAIPVSAAPVGTSRDIQIDGTNPGVIDSFVISAGESVTFPIKVTNAGKQTINSVTLKFGKDDSVQTASNGDATAPTALPDGILVSAAGCSSGSILDCAIGTLGARKSATINVTIATTTATPAAGPFMTEAVVAVAEGGGDAGSNQDTFGAQGAIEVVGWDCDAVAAYRPTGSKTVSTPCGAGEGNKQQSSVTLPQRLTSISLIEGDASDPVVACPAVIGLDCIGYGVFANITGENTGDAITWRIDYDVTGLNINTAKLVVYHYLNDGVTLAPEGGISLAKKNACTAKNPVNCGSALLDSRTNILTITFTTLGNGKTRLLG